MSAETLSFQAEVSKLLHIVTHSLYSNKEIFLRELISNASDACDKVRYEALTNPELTKNDPDFRITLSVDKDAQTLTIADNGIGMGRDELVENLGTIARSGTEAFMGALGGDDKKDVNLIGQFGVGFYSAFMVASNVEVTSKRAGQDVAFKWTSDGKGQYTIAETTRDGRGTTIVMHMMEEQAEYLEQTRLSHIVKTYSDHIAIPIVFEGFEEVDGKQEPVSETLNSASAIWTRAKSEITEDQYKEFYHHVSHAFDDPWLTIHNRVEGVIEYSNLLFIPSQQPFDLFNPERKTHVKLYVRRVFITDDCEEILPSYLRFVRGVVDSEDLPLNVSREMLQHQPVLAKIKTGLTKKILSEIKKKAEEGGEGFEKFWDAFGAVLKEGIYEDFANKMDILEMSRFRTTHGDGLTSLKDYVSRMKDGQDEIYFITGDDLDSLKQSPQLEGFKAKGVEVLLFTDAIDEFWVNGVGSYEEKPLKSITKGGVDLNKVAKPDGEEDTPEEKADKGDIDVLVAAFKIALGDTVKDVRDTDRLTDSPVCIVADEAAMDRHLQRMLQSHGQNVPDDKPVLELNPGHGLIRKLVEITKDNATDPVVADAAFLLLDQARIVEGEAIPDPHAFSRRLSSVMEKGLKV